MFASGTFGAVIGDFCSHNTGLDDAGASILLSPIMAVLFARAAVGASLAADSIPAKLLAEIENANSEESILWTSW